MVTPKAVPVEDIIANLEAGIQDLSPEEAEESDVNWQDFCGGPGLQKGICLERN